MEKPETTFILSITLLILATIVLVIVALNQSPSLKEYQYEPSTFTADQKIVCLVFDGCWKNQLQAVDTLLSYGFRATFAAVTKYTDEDALPYMNWEDLSQLNSLGFDIESQGFSNRPLESLNETQLTQEIVASKQALRDHGYDAEIFVYPYGEGVSNSTVLELVGANYQCARTMQSSKVNMTNVGRYAISAYGMYNTTTRVLQSRLENTGGNLISVIYYHQIGGNGEYSTSIELFNQHMRYLYDNGYTVLSLKDVFLKEAHYVFNP